MQNGKVIVFSSLNKIMFLNLISEVFTVLLFKTNGLIAVKWFFQFDNNVL